MKNTPDVAKYESRIVAEIAAWSAMAEVELITLGKNRDLLKRMLSILPRWAAPCRFVADRCRSLRRQRRATLLLVDSLELRLANLRCYEPLPF